jgi:hypothetical protein
MSIADPSKHLAGRATGDEPVVFSGLRHRPVGSARLAVRDGALVATGFGERGEDGFQVELGRAPGFVPEIELPAEGIAEGGRVVSRTWGRVDGEPDRLTVQLTMERVGEGVRITPDFSAIGARTYELQLFRDGALVHRQPGMSGPAGTALGFAGKRRKVCCRVLVYSGNFLTDVPFVLATGETVMADGVFFVHENATRRVDHLSAVTFTASGLSELRFHPAELAVFDPFAGHTALGGALLGAVPGRLEVSGLGESGDDGVRIDWNKARSWQVRLEEGDAGFVPSGSLWLTGHGSLDGGPDQPLGTAHVEASGVAVEVGFDFSPLAARSVTLEVRHRGETVCYRRGLADATVRLAASAGALAPSYSNSLLGGSRTSPLSAALAWAEATRIALPDGTEAVGDEVVAYPEIPAADIEGSFLAGLDVQAAGLKAFSIVGETVERVTPAGPAFTPR